MVSPGAKAVVGWATFLSAPTAFPRSIPTTRKGAGCVGGGAAACGGGAGGRAGGGGDSDFPHALAPTRRPIRSVATIRRRVRMILPLSCDSAVGDLQHLPRANEIRILDDVLVEGMDLAPPAPASYDLLRYLRLI